MLTFVHLSDLHIGQDGPAAIDLDSDPREEVIEDCKRVVPQLEGEISGVLISGDIANSGESEQYRRAGEWLARLCEALGTAEENVWCVPGNHDFNRDSKPELWHVPCGALRGCSLEEIDPCLARYLGSPVDREVLLEPLAAYHEFASKFGCLPDGPIQTWSEEFELGGGTRLRIEGLNTAILADGKETSAGEGLVLGERAMQLGRGGEDVFVLAMWHHPLSWLRDGDKAETYLNARADVHVFGHEHSHEVVSSSSLLSVSAGALHPRRGQGNWDPRYNFIQFSAAGSTVATGLDVAVFPRVWDVERTAFGPEGGIELKRQDFHLSADGGRAESVEAERVAVDGPVPDETLAVNASSDSYEELTQPVAGRVTNRRRRLSLRYAMLPFVRRIVIAGELGLLDDSDRDVVGFEQTRLVLERASSRGLLGELWDAVADEQEAGQMQPNPYGTVPR